MVSFTQSLRRFVNRQHFGNTKNENLNLKGFEKNLILWFLIVCINHIESLLCYLSNLLSKWDKSMGPFRVPPQKLFWKRGWASKFSAPTQTSQRQCQVLNLDPKDLSRRQIHRITFCSSVSNNIAWWLLSFLYYQSNFIVPNAALKMKY